MHARDETPVSGVFRISKRGGPNFRWPLVLTQRGGQTKFSNFFLWWKIFFFAKGGHGPMPPLKTPLTPVVYTIRVKHEKIMYNQVVNKNETRILKLDEMIIWKIYIYIICIAGGETYTYYIGRAACSIVNSLFWSPLFIHKVYIIYVHQCMWY